ncbi:MAG: hypothetical protein JW818_16450 [Pirellulales bacterium]|nr:hypothetical protein [Pirellulales bacterium]
MSLAVLACSLCTIGCTDRNAEAKRAKVEAQVQRWADKLDAQTTETGVYIRPQKPELPEKDAWDQALIVEYSQGGVAEMLVVRSFGPDGVSHTEDDITARRTAVNLKGAGEGIKKNIGETAEEATKGVMRGVVKGAKEGLKDVFKKKGKKEGDEK